MADANANVRPDSATLNAVIIRADGTRVDLGQISGYYRNPLRRLWWRLHGKPAADRRIRRANATVRN